MMQLDKIANQIRKDILVSIKNSGASHIASAFSIVEILTAIYATTDINLIKLNSEDRDIVILSKGHAGIALYSTLKNFGVLDKDLEKKYYSNGSSLSGHISHKDNLGVEISTGSLGQGLGIANGFALSAKIKRKKSRIYVVVGDGECNEGSVWESIFFASHHNLSNLTLIIDSNSMQGTGFTSEILNQNLKKMLLASGWAVKVVDGHSLPDLTKAMSILHNSKPTCILANTIKGKGVSFMEQNLKYHYKDPQGEDFEIALKELTCES